MIGPIPPYRETIGPTAEWAIEQLERDRAQALSKLARYPFPLFDYAAEDALESADALLQNQ